MQLTIATLLGAIAFTQLGRADGGVAASPRALAARVKTKGPELVQNGGFESGRLAPWVVYSSGTSNDYDSLHSKPAPCIPNEPLTQIKSPGLGAQDGVTRRSNHRFSFCGQATAVINGEPLYPYLNFSEISVDVQQKLKQKTVLGKRYVLTVQYIAESNGVDGEVVFFSAGRRTFQHLPPTSGSAVTQDIFKGTGNDTFVQLSWSADPSDGEKGKLRFVLDNISVRLLDE